MSQVLVVEDEPLIRLDIVALLENAGVDALEFDDGAAAIDYVRAHGDDVAAIFTDMTLKGDVSGLHLARFAAETLPDARVLVTSGRFGRRPRGVPDTARYVAKPWLPKDVVADLAAAVDRHRKKAA